MFLSGIIYSQTLENKNGLPILPDSGEFALGVCASPFLSYAGNFFNGTSGNPSAYFDFITNYTIYGKYFLNPNKAIRGKIRIGKNNYTTKNIIVDDANVVSDPDATVEDKQKVSITNVVLGVGMECRRGKTRVQGFYGAEVEIGFEGYKEKYEYGNAFSSTNTTPTTTTMWANPNPGSPQSNRILDYKEGREIGFGIRVFAGVEYFVAPKFSIGGEFGWGPSIWLTGEGENETEYWKASSSEVVTKTTKVGGKSAFMLDTDNFGGEIYLLFHF